MKTLILNFALIFCAVLSVNAQATDSAKHKLAMHIINQEAPDFKLKDLSGKDVSLAALKGKTVVVDFWATWCGPCKMSFPGMQLAVDHFKNDPNVVFLFIDTREDKIPGLDFIPLVKNFIADNHYTFHVLIDEAGADGKQNKVLKQQNVPGIPTKFIIDTSGRIRFKKIGFMPGMTADALAKEVADMIEISQHPEMYASTK